MLYHTQNFSVYAYKGVFMSHIRGRTKVTWPQVDVKPMGCSTQESTPNSQLPEIQSTLATLATMPAEEPIVIKEDELPGSSQAPENTENVDGSQAIKIEPGTEGAPIAKRPRKGAK